MAEEKYNIYDFISPSVYDTKEKMLDIASRYMNIEDMNVLNTGLFGYITETMAETTRDGIFHRDTLYNEQFINTARFPKSIYNKAKQFDYNVGFAKPAYMKVLYGIKLSDILIYGVVNDERTTNNKFTNLVLSKENEFYIDSFSYRCLHDVTITATPVISANNATDYSITAKYTMDKLNTTFGDVLSPYIKVWTETKNAQKYVFLVLDTWQIKKMSQTFNVFSNDISDLLYYDISYEQQLAGFEIEYVNRGNTSILSAYFNNSYTPSDVEEYCYYTYPNDNKLQIYFSGVPAAFRPKFNTELIVSYYTTEASNANFMYSGDILYKFAKDSFSNIQILCNALTQSHSGKDRENLKEIKQTLIKINLMRNNIITEYDLNYFFNDMVADKNVNGSQIKFYRKQDDILRRQFTGYILLKDSKGFIIPTNTVDIRTDLSQLENHNWVIPAGSIVIYDTAMKEYRLLNDDEYPEEETVDDDNIIMYYIPYHIDIKMEPNPRISYYSNSIIKNIPLSYTYVNTNIPNEFLVANLDIERNAFIENSYTLKLSLNTNLEKAEVENYVKVRAILRNKKTNKEYGYIDFQRNRIEDYAYFATIYTDDSFDSTGRLCLTESSLKDIITEEDIENLFVDENLTLDISVLYQNSKSKEKYGTFATMASLDSFCSVINLEMDEVFSFYRSLTAIMCSDLLVNENGTFILKAIPSVSVKYFADQNTFSDFYNLMEIYELAILDSFSKLENNTTIDLKFYNTYGISQYYSIDKVNLSLKLNIGLHKTYNEATDSSIKDYIRAYTELCNQESFFSTSNLSTELETSIEDISYIEFKGLNNLNQQKIHDLFPNMDGLTKEQIINYVPEYLNISMKRVTYSSDTSFVPDIDITYL